MATIQGLITTTAASQPRTYDFECVSGFSIEEETPTGTSIRYLVKISPSKSWQKYDFATGAWTGVATQEVTPASVMNEGMSSQELMSIPESGMLAIKRRAIDVAIALQSENENTPAVSKFAIVGKRVSVGSYITDGTVKWIVDDATQGDSVGDITLHPVLLPGHVKADGSTVKASEYPRLLAWVQENNMLGSDAAHYTYDESADTLKFPDAQGRFLQSGNAVEVKEAGLPNITGQTVLGGSGVHVVETDNGESSGCIYFPEESYGVNVLDGSSSFRHVQKDHFTIDASRSNAIYGSSTTVQPPSITLIAQIKF